jgi:hypothetical protein
VREADLLERLRAYLQLEPALPAPEAQASFPLVFPPAEVMVGLLEAGRRVDIRALLAQAEQLAQANPQYRPFTAEVRTLAQGFQLKQLQHFLITARSAP